MTTKMLEKSRATLIERLGEAVDLIDDFNYLGMYRNRQIHYQKEFEFTIKLAKTKRSPKRFFASIWAKKNLKKTLDWIGQMINRLASEAAHKRYQEQTKRRLDYEAKITNQRGLETYQLLKRQMLPNLS